MKFRIDFYAVNSTSIVSGSADSYSDAIEVARAFVGLNPQGVAVVLKLRAPSGVIHATYTTVAILVGHAIGS